VAMTSSVGAEEGGIEAKSEGGEVLAVIWQADTSVRPVAHHQFSGDTLTGQLKADAKL